MPPMAQLPPGFHLPPSPFPQLNVDQAWLASLYDPKNPMHSWRAWGNAIPPGRAAAARQLPFSFYPGEHAALQYGFFGPRRSARI